jgi:hypothetical protein
MIDQQGLNARDKLGRINVLMYNPPMRMRGHVAHEAK